MPAFVKTLLIDAPVDDVFRFFERGRVGLSRWVAQHTVCKRNRLFKDQQIHRPIAKWVPRHDSEAAGGMTRLGDHIDYELPGGSLVNTVFGWTVSLDRREMFPHGHRVTKGVCEKRSVGEAL